MMKVYKFGGASVKDAKAVRNLVKVLNTIDRKNIVLVVSAMGKMTNAFEEIVAAYIENRADVTEKIQFVRDYHDKIMEDLFKDKTHKIFEEVNTIFLQLSGFMIKNNNKDYNFCYDQIVSQAELISTKIVSTYLNEKGLENQWTDVREYIKTNSNYREAIIDWKQTEANIKTLANKDMIVTQGFLGSDTNQNTTTLGREGSDYTGAVFAYCLDAESLSIFKDVDGVLNADPRYFDDTVLYEQIAYREAIEMAFYGASVIHPKTIQPIQRKEIPLYVKSFVNPLNKGTTICSGIDLKPKRAGYIIKKDQVLVSISSKDFSFIMEKNISDIFKLLHQFKLKVNLIQNTAISFSVCLEDKYNTFSSFLEELKLNYKGLYNENVSLITIRHYTKQAVKEIESTYEVLVKQTSRETVQFVVK